MLFNLLIKLIFLRLGFFGVSVSIFIIKISSFNLPHTFIILLCWQIIHISSLKYSLSNPYISPTSIKTGMNLFKAGITTIWLLLSIRRIWPSRFSFLSSIWSIFYVFLSLRSYSSDTDSYNWLKVSCSFNYWAKFTWWERRELEKQFCVY